MKDTWIEPRLAVEAAIEALEAQPRHYGGHLASEASSTIDGVARDVRQPVLVLHDDGRVGRLTFGPKPNGRHEPNAACVLFTGEREARVVPARKLAFLT